MNQLNLNQVRIASPCHADWDAMKGDHRARFCGTCRKHVYNLSTMTPTEIEGLIRAKEGRFCARFYRRQDGTILTADCRVGRRRRRKRDLLGLALATMGVAAAYFGMGAYFARAERFAASSDAPLQRLLTTEWGCKIVNFFHGRFTTPVVMGKIAVMGDVYVPPPPPPNPSANKNDATQ